MKLLSEFYSYHEAVSVAERLESNGIPTYVSGKHTFQTGSYAAGAFKCGLWILIEEQHDDASALVDNPNHVVTSGISTEEIETIRQKVAPQFNKVMTTLLIYGSLLAITMLLVFLLAWNNAIK